MRSVVGWAMRKRCSSKRDPFKHETEVRLVYVEHRDGYGSDHIFAAPFDPNSTFEEVMLDPRLHPDDVKEREAEFSSLGFKHPVKKSNLYQRVLYEIVLDERGLVQRADLAGRRLALPSTHDGRI